MQTDRLILASGSPRRQQFLHELGLDFRVVVADIDETPRAGETPVALAHRLALAKAEAVTERLPNRERTFVIAGDTVVALDDLLLGKPADERAATTMLQMLRNRVHYVHSSVCLLDRNSGSHIIRVNSTAVQMRNYTDQEIAAYVQSKDPLDKAGGYAIQHPTFAPVAALQGCIAGVIGLPLADLRDLLAECGISVPVVVEPICERHNNFGCCQRSGSGWQRQLEPTA